jgi:GH15 family glucan-1,4-alpha-glucosidase
VQTLTREIVTGNGRLTVALDDCLTIRDFYYPLVGSENHLSGHALRIGVWVDNTLSWIGSEWQTETRYLPETLVSNCHSINRALDIELEVNDAVDSWQDIFLRKIVVRNLSASPREIRLFFSHDFCIGGWEAGDTALYHPGTEAVIHYKGQRYFLINGITEHNQGIFQFTTGFKKTDGTEGTWRDAEDGLLSENPIAQGTVDSTISFKLRIPAGSFSTVHYWIACGKNVEAVEELNSRVKVVGVEQLLLETGNYWSSWVNKRNLDLSRLPEDAARLFKTSLLIMRIHVDNNGGIISSLDSDGLQFNRDTLAYVWPREAAIAAMAFDQAGFEEISRLFFEFCNKTISRKGYFYHKYAPDGSQGSSWYSLLNSRGKPRLPIQEDQTALVIQALWEHFQRYRDMEFVTRVYPNLVLKSTQFLLSYLDEFSGLPEPSFDIWEEQYGVFTATVSTIYGALIAAAKFARTFNDSQRYQMLSKAAASLKEAMLKHLYDKETGIFLRAIYPDGSRDASADSSLAFLFDYGPFTANNLVVLNTLNQISRSLWWKNDTGGLARYENDACDKASKAVKGNPWIISTLWLAKWQIARATNPVELQKGLELISWTVSRASKSGLLSEQIDPFSGRPFSASPRLWSHAEYVLTVFQYLEKYQKLNRSNK